MDNKLWIQTFFHEQKNPHVKGSWPISIDIGYSAVKAISPNWLINFPSFAKKIDKRPTSLTDLEDNFLLYEGSEGLWLVGAEAIEALKYNDHQDDMLLERYWVESDMYRVIAKTALGLANRGNAIMKRERIDELYIQSGLPMEFRNDLPQLKKVFSGSHEFSLQIGNRKPMMFSLSVGTETVGVMTQPLGALYGAMYNDLGQDLGMDFLQRDTVVFDGGYGSFDSARFISGKEDRSATSKDYAMSAVVKAALDHINKTYHQSFRLHVFQKYLKNCKVPIINRGARSRHDIELNDILAASTREIAERALREMDTLYDFLVESDYLILSGGTCAAWLPYIKRHYKDLTTLKIVQPTHSLPVTFTNVRGYSLYLHNALKGKLK